MKSVYRQEYIVKDGMYGWCYHIYDDIPDDYVLKVGEKLLDDEGETIDSYLGEFDVFKGSIDKLVGRELSRKEWETFEHHTHLYIDSLIEELKVTE